MCNRGRANGHAEVQSGVSRAPDIFGSCTGRFCGSGVSVGPSFSSFNLESFLNLHHLTLLAVPIPLLTHPFPVCVANMSDEPRKRSRFDQTEPEPARKSRFDRRSRSPAARKDSESHRSRSPIDGSSPGDKKSAAAAAAAAAAAKINASINAKKGIQHVDVPPIRTVGLCPLFAVYRKLTDVLYRLNLRLAQEQPSHQRDSKATSTNKMATTSKTSK